MNQFNKNTDHEFKGNGNYYTALLDNISGSIWSIDRNYCLIYGNASFLREFHKEFGFEIKIGDSILNDSIPTDEKNLWKEYYNYALNGENFNFESEWKFGKKQKWYEYHLSPIFDKNNECIGASVVANDITDRKNSEQELIQSEEKFRALYNNAPLSFQSLNEDGSFRDVNPAWLRTLGYKKEEVIGKKYIDFLHPNYKGHFKSSFPKFKELGYVHDVQFQIRHKDGNYLDISFEGCVGYHPDGSFKQTYCVFQDITEHRKAEKALLESEVKFRNMSEQIREMIYLTDDKGKLYYISPASMTIFGFSPQEMEGNLFMKYLKKTEIPKAIKEFLKTILSGSPVIDLQLKMKHKSGKIFIGELAGTSYKSEDFKGTIGVIRDISRQVESESEIIQAKDTAERYLDLAGNMILSLNKVGEIELINQKGLEILEYSRDEILGKSWFDTCISKEDVSQVKDVFQKIILGKAEFVKHFENEVITKNGEKKIISWYNTLLRDKKGKIDSILSSGMDITERIEFETKIINNLKEKDILLRELYHRTKNNMQVITSMLSMQARKSDNDEIRSLFKEVNNRIRSMSLVHQKLYESQDLSRINLKDYIQDLVKLLAQTYSLSSNNITFKFELEDLFIMIDTAVPLGLIINELISNVFKHAFPDEAKGILNIHLYKEDNNKINIVIKDNGIGIPIGLDLRKNDTMGLRTMFILAEHQLKGNVTYESKNGLQWHIAYNDTLYTERI
jgi:PAS domain S-box-containing protein